MNLLQIPRIMLSGHKSGAGKTLISIGLSVALRKRNISLSFCVNGALPIQAMVLKRLTRRYVRCLDVNLLSGSQLLAGIQQAAMGSDLLLIHGQQGLFDGVGPGSLKGSDAELASLSRTPVVLIADADGLNNSIAALIKGYSEFAQGFSVAGIVANKCNFNPDSEEFNNRLGDKLRDKIYYDSALQSFGMSALIGAIPKVKSPFPEIVKNFSQAESSISLPLQFFKDAGQLAEQHIDITKLIDIANTAPDLRIPDNDANPMQRRTRIAVSDDTCFSFGFQDNMDLIRYYGAEIAGFSPLADEELPKRIGAVYLTGAMLDGYGEEVAKNQNIKNSIREFVNNGGIIFSEGAGTAYLCEQFQGTEEGVFHEGVGIIKGRAVKEPSGFHYNESIITEDSILGRSGLVFKGVSVGEWKLDSKTLISRMLRISDGTVNTYEEGYSPGAQIVSTFTFPHFGSSPQLAKNLVDAAEIVAKV